MGASLQLIENTKRIGILQGSDGRLENYAYLDRRDPALNVFQPE
jgi:hypothetical protein